MESECSLPHSQKPATIPHRHILLLNTNFPFTAILLLGSSNIKPCISFKCVIQRR